jgi:ribosomal protein L10
LQPLASIIVAEYRGLGVAAITNLRKQARIRACTCVF